MLQQIVDAVSLSDCNYGWKPSSRNIQLAIRSSQGKLLKPTKICYGMGGFIFTIPNSYMLVISTNHPFWMLDKYYNQAWYTLRQLNVARENPRSMEVLVGKSSINRGWSIATFPESPVFAMALSNRRELSIAHFYRSDAATKQAHGLWSRGYHGHLTWKTAIGKNGWPGGWCFPLVSP